MSAERDTGTEEVAPDGALGPVGPRHGRRGRPAALGLLVLAVVLGVLVWRLAQRTETAAAPQGSPPRLSAAGAYTPGTVPATGGLGTAEIGAAERAAVAAVPPALSYDYRKLTADVTAATSRMTPAFATQFRATFAATVKPLAISKQAVSQARVRAAGIVSASGSSRASGAGHVDVLVFVDQVLVSSKVLKQQAAPVKVGQTRVLLRMVPVGHAWLVDDLRPL